MLIGHLPYRVVATRLSKASHLDSFCDTKLSVSCRNSPLLSYKRANNSRPCSTSSGKGVEVRCCSPSAEQTGVATAHSLAATASAVNPVVIHLYDLAGLGSGGSGAAGGLLHPFSPKGKLLWQGQEAFEAALELIASAENGVRQHHQQTGTPAEQFVWRQDILRPAADAKQAAGFEGLSTGSVGKSASVCAVSSHEALALLPGLNACALPDSPTGSTETAAAALLIKGGLVLHPHRYLRAVWQHCQAQLADLQNGSEACLKLQQVDSLTQLEEQHGPYDALVVAAGAAAATLPEVGNVLPLRLCQGYGLELVPAVNPHNGYLNTESASVRPPVTTKAHQQQQADATSRCQKLEEEASTSDLTHVTSNQLMPHSAPHAESFPAGAPSLVGATYMGVQGAQQISVGATKQFGLSPEEALQECGRGVTDPGEVAQAEGLLRPKAEGLWSPAASWQVARVRTGVRALPQKTADGAIPLAGQLPSAPKDKQWWIVGGLGARGLVYHAWLGKLLAQAVLQGSDTMLPTQLLRWKPQNSS